MVATGIRSPRRQGTPPICPASVVMRLNSMMAHCSRPRASDGRRSPAALRCASAFQGVCELVRKKSSLACAIARSCITSVRWIRVSSRQHSRSTSSRGWRSQDRGGSSPPFRTNPEGPVSRAFLIDGSRKANGWLRRRGERAAATMARTWLKLQQYRRRRQSDLKPVRTVMTSDWLVQILRLPAADIPRAVWDGAYAFHAPEAVAAPVDSVRRRNTLRARNHPRRQRILSRRRRTPPSRWVARSGAPFVGTSRLSRM